MRVLDGTHFRHRHASALERDTNCKSPAMPVRFGPEMQSRVVDFAAFASADARDCSGRAQDNFDFACYLRVGLDVYMKDLVGLSLLSCSFSLASSLLLNPLSCAGPRSRCTVRIAPDFQQHSLAAEDRSRSTTQVSAEQRSCSARVSAWPATYCHPPGCMHADAAECVSGGGARDDVVHRAAAVRD